jgi:hypothetical protein
VKILRARVPEASPEQVSAVARINESIRAIPGVQNKPGLRELIDLLAAFVRDDVRAVSEGALGAYVGYLAKQQSQAKSLRLALARVVSDVHQPDAVIDAWVASAFGREQLVLREAA